MRVVPGLYLSTCDDNTLEVSIRIISASTVNLNGLFAKAKNKLYSLAEKQTLSDKLSTLGDAYSSINDTLNASMVMGYVPETLHQGELLTRDSLTVNPFGNDDDYTFAVPNDYYLLSLSFVPTLNFDVSEVGLSWILDCVGICFRATYSRIKPTKIPQRQGKSRRKMSSYTALAPMYKSNDDTTVFETSMVGGDLWIYVAPDSVERLWGSILDPPLPPEHIYFHLLDNPPRQYFSEMGRELWGFLVADLPGLLYLPIDSSGLRTEVNAQFALYRLSLPYATSRNQSGSDNTCEFFPFFDTNKPTTSPTAAIITLLLTGVIDDTGIRDWWIL